MAPILTAISILDNTVFHDPFGQVYFTQADVCDILYRNPKIDLSRFQLEDAEQYNSSIRKLNADLDPIAKYQTPTISLEQFDQDNQNKWMMPKQYQDLDIRTELLARCVNTTQRDRVELELKFFEENNLLDLVRYIKYLVDTMNQHNIVWGVGRGSSTASYVLYLLGLHMIDPIEYDIPLEEFFKQGH